MGEQGVEGRLHLISMLVQSFFGGSAMRGIGPRSATITRVHDFVELLDQFRAESLLDDFVLLDDQRPELGHQPFALRRQADDDPALVPGHPGAGDQAHLFHARQHAGQAGAEDVAMLADFPRFELFLLVQRAQNGQSC